MYLFLTFNVYLLGCRLVRASAFGTVDCRVIPSRGNPMTLELIFLVFQLDAQHQRNSVKNKWQVYLCGWERHLAGFPHLGVVDRWPATSERARYSALIAFL